MSKHTLPQLLADLDQDAAKVTGFAREIVAKRVTLVNGLTAAVTFFGIPAATSGPLEKGLQIGLTVAGFIGSITWARAGTTPADPALTPTSSNGNPLVESFGDSAPADIVDDTPAPAVDDAPAAEPAPAAPTVPAPLVLTPVAETPAPEGPAA